MCLCHLPFSNTILACCCLRCLIFHASLATNFMFFAYAFCVRCGVFRQVPTKVRGCPEHWQAQELEWLPISQGKEEVDYLPRRQPTLLAPLRSFPTISLQCFYHLSIKTVTTRACQSSTYRIRPRRFERLQLPKSLLNAISSHGSSSPIEKRFMLDLATINARVD